MHYSKKDFTFHKLICNKYFEQTYLSYLARGNKKFRYHYVYNGYDNDSAKPVKSYIVITYDFIVRCNNAICRRGSIQTNINDIKKLYDNPVESSIWVYPHHGVIENFYKADEKTENETQEIMYNYLREIIEWKQKFENDFEGFKDFIYNAIVFFDKNHYSWLVGENIVYNSSLKDNAEKKYYCSLSNEYKYMTFKNIYSQRIYIESNIDVLTEQISNLFFTMTDTYNLLVSKKYDKAIELLSDYIDENNNMKQCLDIYYAKLYMNMIDVLNTMCLKKYSESISIIKSYIVVENKKYNYDDFLLFENIRIIEDKIEFGQYFEI